MPTANASVSTQPHSLEAEKTVLGALLLDPEAITKVAATLRPDDFYDPLYKKVYEACLHVYEGRAPVDVVTVSEALDSDEAINRLGGMAFLVSLIQDVPTSSHVTNYAAIVKDKARRRSLIRAGQRITGFGFESQEFPAMLEQSQSALLAVADAATETKAESLKTIAERRFEQIAEVQASGDTLALRRVYSGFQNIDYYFNGFAPGSLTVIAARPSMGKTALATNIALNAATKAQKHVLIFSLEMTKEEVVDRITASSIGVPTWKIEKGDINDEQVRQIGMVIDGFTDCRLYVDDDPDTTLSNLRAKAIRHRLENGLDLLIVDYLQLIEVPRGMTRENRVQEISMISRGLKQLARELSIPIIALSQLSRAVENRPGNIPQLSDLRESGSIEQDAHNVLMLYREGYYNEDCENPNLTTVFIRKNRQGPVGPAELIFNKELMRFSPLQR